MSMNQRNMINKWMRKQTKKFLKHAMKTHVDNANEIDELARRYGMENDQEFLDWQDSINEISVR